MHRRAVQRVVGLLAMLFSGTMLPPVLISLLFDDGAMLGFLASFAIILATGLALWYPVRHDRSDLRLRDGYVVVVSFWAGLGVLGAIPLIPSAAADMNITDAVFESISGLTTTGATVLVGIDALPESVLWYRQQLQWLGGMGIIVLAVAILPMLGIGGMQLYRAEIPGPVKDNKLTPRITQTAKALWYLYFGLTSLCALAYWGAGMDLFDAITHAFSTLSTGGFSTHDASFGYFDSQLLWLIATVFMFTAGCNFALHFMAWRSVSIAPYRQDAEFRAYTFYVLAATAAVVGYLLVFGDRSAPLRTAASGLFHVASIATSTGFTVEAFHLWPGLLPVLLIFTSFIGGSAGSSAGGMKVIRGLLMLKQGARELVRLVHPAAEVPIKLGQRTVSPQVVEAVYGFFSAYVVLFAVMLLLLMATGLDQVTAFSAVAACLNNLGPGLGDVAANYGEINDFSKWVLVGAMLLGRLEIFTLLVLLTPAFWRY